MAARMGVDIAPKAIFGKQKCPILRAVKPETGLQARFMPA
jgi:hypothetical protein